MNGQWLQPGALATMPAYARVPEEVLAGVVRSLSGEPAAQQRMDAAFRVLERDQPALAAFLASELTSLDQQAAQALCYFLSLAVFLAFRESFGPRLGRLSQHDLDAALESLVADGEVRGQTCQAGSYSEDVIAIGQPAVMGLLGCEIELAPEEAGDLGQVMQALLLQVLALTHAVAPA